MSVALATTWEERLADLGNIPASRVRTIPKPGTATIEDVVRMSESEGRLFELVDGTLVDKAMDWQESLVAGVIVQKLNNYLDEHSLGVATGPDGLTRLFSDTVRGPDVAFIAWSRLPNGRIPTDPIPDLVPNFVVEVLSVSNTYSEMSRKRFEYFHAGVELLWMVDCRSRSVTVFRSPHDALVVTEGQSLDGGKVLPGWHLGVSELFNRLDRSADTQ